MLYVTTRDLRNVHTARHPLCKDRDSEGGLYIPFQKVHFAAEEIALLKEKPFNHWVAELLNLFFSTKLSSWDVDFCIGRHPFQLVPMSHKILIAETWNNPENTFSWLIGKLKGLVLQADAADGPYSDWTWISVRIAVLFGIFSELSRLGLAGINKPIDISVCTGDFSAPMAVWYAREMGLPIGKIIFGCNENSAAWDLLHRGELHANAAVTAEGDHCVPQDLERLIYERLGREETLRFVQTVQRRGVYTLTEEKRQVLSDGLFGAVVSKRRMESVIRNVYRTNSYLLGPDSALAYGALQDYRATKSEATPAMILTEKGPACDTETVSQAMGEGN